MHRFTLQRVIRIVLQGLYNSLIPTLLTLLALAGLWYVAQQMERPAFDLLSRMLASPVQNSPVTLVLVDDESIARLKNRFGPLPWPRKTYVEIFRRIAGSDPALMVFDGHFININEKDDQTVFAAMRQFPNLITGLVMEEYENKGPGLSAHRTLNTDLPQYYRLNLGVVSVRQDVDGVIRTLKPVYQMRTGQMQTGIFPALSLAAAYQYLNSQPLATRYSGSSWILDIDRSSHPPRLKIYPESQPKNGLALPMSAENAFYLHWYRLMPSGPEEYQHSHPAIPLWRFFENRQALNLHGRIALIGASSTFYRDYHQTPIAHRHLGPDIHATAIDNILQGRAIQKVGNTINLLMLLALSLLVIMLRFQVRNFGRVLLYTVGTMVIYCSLVVWLFSERGLWLDWVTPELFMMIAFLAGSTFRIIFKERQLEAMEKSLAQLVDPEVFREIQRMSHVLKPGGSKLEITSMFVDIRNFTTLAEHLQPMKVTELLNEFYADIVSVIFHYHGTIDKFMGDGILIIFGAPLPDENHRVLALKAAHDILETTERLSQRWKETQGIDTEICISLNSGPAFVGFLGPADKLEYTGVGDTVNICVRLQEQAKQFNTRLILSEATLTGAQEQLQNAPYIELGEVLVRGRESTTRVFTLQQALMNAGDSEGKK